MITYTYFCPKCESPAVDRPLLFGGRASCRKCGWNGMDFDLEVAATVGGAVDEQLFLRTCVDLKNVLRESQLILPLGRFLLRWGFTRRDALQKELPLYMDAVAKAVMLAIVRTRESIEVGSREEKADAGRSETSSS